MKHYNNKSILLVEDEVITAMMEIDELKEKGYNVIHIFTGEEAVDFLKNEKQNVDIILMDIDLGKGIDGTEAAQRILEYKDVPILFLSSHTEPEIVEKTEKITSYGYVVKQSTITVLDASIKMAFKLYEAKIAEKQKEDRLQAVISELEVTNEEYESQNEELMRSEEELIHKEKILQSSEEEYRSTLNNLVVGVVVHRADSSIIMSNPEASNILGLSSDQMIGKLSIDPAWSFIREDFSILDVADYPVSKVISTKKNLSNDILGINRPDRDYVTWVMVNAVPVMSNKGELEKVIVNFIDITKEKKADEALNNSRIQHQTLVETIPDLVWLKNADGIYLSCNQTFETFFGAKESDIIGKTDYDFVDKELADFFRDHDRKAMEADAPSMNDEWLTFADTGYHGLFETIKSPMRDKMGNLVGILGIARDITSRKKAENDVKDQLAEKEILLKEVHHRIKNNIASIESLLRIQSSSITNLEALSALQDAIGRIQSMRILYDKILQSSEYQNSSVKNYIESLVETIFTVFPDRNDVIVNMDLSDLNLDSKKMFPLGIIINELITNSIKYLSENNEENVINISITVIDNLVTLVIQDNGIGFPENFELNKSEGFGLVIVKMLSKQLNGSFFVENNHGARSIVEFKI